MLPISVVIVCKNEAGIIGKTLQTLQGITDDIVIYDNGSTDNTAEIVKPFGVQWHTGAWEGFGLTKQKAARLAKYDWVMALDADEGIDETLKQSLQAINLNDEQVVYEMKFKNFLGDKYLKYGEWGGDKHIRLFNRKQVNWDEAPVHESLVKPESIVVKQLPGYVLHWTVRDIKAYALKMVNYAMLNADKYYRQGKKASWFKLRLSPGFTFIHYYVLKLGFLDGHAGYVCAKMTAYYTCLKYARLRELTNEDA